MAERDRYLSYCPVCGSALRLDEERGYYCSECGWDEASETEEEEVWIDLGDAKDDERD